MYHVNASKTDKMYMYMYLKQENSHLRTFITVYLNVQLHVYTCTCSE